MRSRLLWKLYLGYVALIVFTALSLGVFLARDLEARYLAETQESLRGSAVLFREVVRSVLSEEFGDGSASRLQQEVGRLGDSTGTRFTLIDQAGIVLADSDADPAFMENHADRIEVIAALRDGFGVGTRYSATLKTRMMYVALPAEWGSGGKGVARTAVSLDAVGRRLSELRANVALGALVASVLALGLGVYFARSFSRPYIEMSQAVRSIAKGKYQRRLSFHRGDELGVLAQSVNVIAGELEQRIQTITQDRNRLLTILTAMVEGVVAVDLEGRVLHLNEVAGRMFGVDPQTAPGRPLTSLTRVLEVVESLTETIQTGVVRQREIILPGRNEQILEIHSAPIRDNEGTLIGAVVVVHDVTELRRLEGVRRDFVANVSHELKTPITVIRGTIETILSDDRMDPETRDRFLSKVSNQTERLSSIVSDLLTLARVESGGTSVEVRPVDFRELVAESVRALSVSAESRSVSLDAQLPDEPVQIMADWGSLRLAVDNLLDNAVKYTPVGGEVGARLTSDGQSARLEVVDTGIGIETQHLDRIFERFYRVDKARSRELGGTGLGLSIVKHMVMAHHGQVSVQSSPGRGSAFLVRIPLASAEATAQATQSE